MVLCLAFEAYISAISSLSWLRERDLLNLMEMSPSGARPFAGDLECFRLIMLEMVVYSTLLLLFLVILSSNYAFLA